MTINYWLDGKLVKTVDGDDELIKSLEEARDAQTPISINGPLWWVFAVYYGNEINVYVSLEKP